MTSRHYSVGCLQNDKINILLERKIILFMGPLKIGHWKMWKVVKQEKGREGMA